MKLGNRCLLLLTLSLLALTTIKLLVEAGKNYFVWQEVKMGLFSARSELKQVDDGTGRQAVAECTRAESSF